MAERDERLQNAIDRIKNLDDSMKVNLKGKKYTMVAQRVQAFREAFGCGANISTEIVVCDDQKVIVKATVSVQRDGAWVPIATEFAEEYRGVGMVNKTSALENCCTSSIGRALAACGLSGGEYASSFEVDNAINNKRLRLLSIRRKRSLTIWSSGYLKMINQNPQSLKALTLLLHQKMQMKL